MDSTKRRIFHFNSSKESQMKPPIFTMRIMQCTFIVSVLMFIYVLRITHPPVKSVDATLQWIIVLIAAVSALAGFIVQQLLMRTPSQSLPQAPNSTPLNRWFSGHIFRFATAESVALFGFALRMMGSTSVIVTLLFGSSLLLLLIWQPGTCPPQNKS
jgi:hypothetical protein